MGLFTRADDHPRALVAGLPLYALNLGDGTFAAKAEYLICKAGVLQAAAPCVFFSGSARSAQFSLPKHLAGILVVSAEFPVGGRRHEDESARCHAAGEKCAPGIAVTLLRERGDRL